MADIEIFNESGMQIPLTEGDFQIITGIISKGEGRIFTLLEIVYVDEQGIIEVNSRFLNRNYVTDIITFSYSDDLGDKSMSDLEGTLYMCPQRISEQATEFQTTLVSEFQRVFIHGLLHLCGYNDDTTTKKSLMTELENKYLGLL